MDDPGLRQTSAEPAEGRSGRIASRLPAKRRPWLLGAAVAIAVMIGIPQQARPITCLKGPFFVFFDLNDDTLNEDAAGILDNMILARNMCDHDGGLAIVGYADRSGSSRHNLSLARRRAERDRAYAARRGVPDEMMTVEAQGEGKPLVVTPDGVQEPQNRRVEVRYPLPKGW